MKNKQRKAVSSVVATLLILGLTVSVFAIASLTTFSLLPDQTAQPTVELHVDTENSEATVVDAGNADELTLSGNPDENISNVTVGKQLDLNNGNQNPNVVATVDGNDVLVEEVDKESLPGTTLSVTYNPPVEGAVVEALDANGDIIETATTPNDGEVRLLTQSSDIENIRVVADGASINQSGFNGPEQLYAEQTKSFAPSASSPTFDFVNSNAAIADVDGTSTAVIYDTDSSGTRLVSNLAELQVMTAEPNQDYKLVSNIDASPTESWNAGSGFEPIAFGADEFTGSFDGAGNQISELTIDRRDSSNVALFSDATGDSDIENVNLKSIEVRGENDVGAAVASGTPTTANIRFSGLVNAAPDIESDIALSNGNTLVRNTQKFTVKASDVRDDSLDYKIDGNADGDSTDGVDKKVLGKTQNRQVTLTDPYGRQNLVRNGPTKEIHVTVTDEHGQRTTSKVSQDLEINKPPTVSSELSFNDATLVSSNQRFTVTAEDANGDNLDYRLDVDNDGDFTETADKSETDISEGQSVTFGIDYSSSGSKTVNVEVKDPSGETVSDSITVSLNTPPTLVSGSGEPSFNQDTLTHNTQELTVTATDQDSDDLTYRLDVNNDGDFNDNVDKEKSGQTEGQQVSFTNLYSSGGDKTLELEIEDSTGGTVTETISVDINQQPTINSGITVSSSGGSSDSGSSDGLVSNSQSFNISASDPDGDSLTYRWDFGDGQSATGSSVQHTYSNSGSKTVTVTVTDSNGAKNSYSTTVELNRAPDINRININSRDFSANRVTVEADVSEDKSIRDYSWEFENDRISGDSSLVTNTFSSDGNNKYISLTVTDSDGVTETKYTTVDLSDRPTIDSLTYDGGNHVSTSKEFVATASDRDKDSLTYRWDFDDGSSATGASVNHKYSNRNRYRVELTVTDETGKRDSGRVYVNVRNNAPRINDIDITSKDESSDSVTVRADAYDDRGIVEYDWEFENTNSNDGGYLASNTFTDGNNKQISLTVTDENGRTDSTQTTVDLANQPNINNVDISGQDTVSDSKTFSVSASDVDRDGLTYSWDFGDGSSASGRYVSHSYSTSGTYYPEVTVEDPTGRTDTASRSVGVIDPNEPPSIDSLSGPSSEITTGETAVLDADASDSDGDSVSLSYSAEGGATKTNTESVPGGEYVSYEFSQTGTHTVTVTGDDGNGGTDTATTDVTVVQANRPPRISISAPNSVEEGQPATFSVDTSDPDGDSVSLAYSSSGTFIDSESTSTGRDVTFEFGQTGTDSIVITANDKNGGITTATADVTVVQPQPNRAPSVSISGPSSATQIDTRGTNGGSVTFNVDASDPDGDSVSLSYSAESGSQATKINTVSTSDGGQVEYKFGNIGTHTVTVTASDGNGGTTTATADATLAPVLYASSPSNAKVGEPVSVEASRYPYWFSDDDYSFSFTANGGGATKTSVQYDYNIGPGREATFEFSQTGTHSVTVTISNGDASISETEYFTIDE